MTSAEEWREVPGYDGRYEVSSLGRVRSWVKSGPGGHRRSEPLIMTPFEEEGYFHIFLRDGKKVTRYGVHRLLALAFLGPPPTKDHLACHEDGVPSNNVVGNIRWDTQVGNQADRLRHGTDVRGTKQVTAKLNEKQVLEIRVRSGENQRALASEFGVSQAQIQRIITRKAWSWL